MHHSPVSPHRPGDRVGIFTVMAANDDEVLLGDSDKHLDVVLSLCKQSTSATRGTTLAVTTVVHVHNLLGRRYMIPVAPLHRRIAPAVLARLARVPTHV